MPASLAVGYDPAVHQVRGFAVEIGAVAKEFAPCTNCGGEDGPWILSVLVTKEGLYPFELLQYNASGDASLEWLVPHGWA